MASMTESAGALSTAYDTYMNTTQAHIDQFKASFTDLSMTIFDSESTKGVIDFLNSIIQFLNDIIQHFGLLSTAIAGVGIYKFIKNFSHIKVLGLQNATSIDMVAAATTKMTASETAAALVTTKLSQTQRIQILMLKGLTEAEAREALGKAENIAATTAEIGVTKGLTGATLTLKTAVNGLFTAIKSHPFIAIAAAILSVIALAKKAADEFEEWRQESIEKGKTVADESNQLTELIDKYRQITAQGKLDKEARDEIQNVQNQIVELVGAQANNLDLVNGKLDTEQDKLNKIANSIIDMPTLETAYNTARDNTQEQKKVQIAPWGEGVSPFANEGYISSNLIPAQGGKEFKAILDKVMKDYGFATAVGEYELKFSKIDENDFKSRIDAYNQILEELRTSKTFDTESDLFTKLLQQKQELEDEYKKQVEAAGNYLNGLINREWLTSGNEVKSYEDYLAFRDKLIKELMDDDKVSEMIKENVFDEEGIESSVDGILSQLGGFKDYYSQWYDEFGSESAKKTAEIKEKLKSEFANESPEIENWFSKLTTSDKDIIAKIDVDTDTAKWKLSDWQNALDEYKKQLGEDVNETNNLFAQLMTETGTAKDPSFVEKTEKSIEKLQKLQDALTKVESGTLKDSERMSLFKTFPQLTAYADNLAEGIKHVTDSMRSDIVSSFNEQIAKFNEQGASEEEIAQLNAYKDTVLGIADAVVTTQNALSSMQTVFQDLDKIVKDYNENQYFSLESLEKLSTSSGQKYLQYLTYENGQLKVNEEAYKKLVLAQIDEIETKATLQATTDLQSLSDETTAKEYLAKVNIDLADSQLTAAQAAFQYALALKLSEGGNVAKAAQKVADNLNTLRNIFASAREQAKSYSGAMLGAATATDKKAKASEKAKDALEKEQKALERTKESLENEKKALEKNKSEYEKAKNAIQDLIEWTQKYIKQIKENEIKALEEQKDKFDEIIEKRKEQLQAEKDLHEYEKSLSEKQNTLASNALKAAVASLDDSAAGKKAYKKAQEEYKTSQTDLQDFLYEHEIDVRQESLDKLKEDTDKSYQDQIDTIQDFLNDEVKMYREACSMIDNDNGSLYGKLLDYCLNYTTTGRAEFDHMWTTAKTAMETYNTANLSTLDLMNDLQGRIYDIDNAIDSLTLNIESYESRISSLKNQIDDLKDAAIEAQNALNMTNTKPLGGTSFWVNYNGKKYQTGNTYNGDTEANRLLAANELTKLIAKDVSGFDNYGLSIVQGLLGVGGNKTGHHWTYTFQGKTYESRAATRDNAIADILSQISKKFGGVYPASASTIYGTIKGYAEGTKAATGGLHIVDEEGLFSEFIPYQIGKGRYSFLPEGNPVFSKAMTNTLFDFASDPAKFVNSIRNESSKSNISTSMVINIQGNADRETVRQLKEFEQKYSNERLMKMSLNNKRII